MASPEVLDFTKLLAPVSEESPTGSDLRADISPLSDFQKIKEDRKAARQTETQLDRGTGDPAQDAKLVPPDWRPLVDRAVKVLAEKSKDMEVTAYMIEGLTRTKGFAGIRDGFRLAADLISTYGDALYPSPGDQDVENRFSHLLQLNGIESTGALIVPIAKIPLTGETSGGIFALTHYQAARALAKIPDAKARQARIDKGAITIEIIQKAVVETPAAFFIDLVDDINASLDQFRRFCDTIYEKTKYEAQSDNLRGALESYLEVVMDLARAKLPPPGAAKAADAVAAAVVEAPPAGAPAAAVPAAAGVIRNRDDALEALGKVAEFFRKNEPQSVVPYALEQVIHWGQMPLPDLLLELIPEEGPRKNLFKQVGIKPP